MTSTYLTGIVVGLFAGVGLTLWALACPWLKHNQVSQSAEPAVADYSAQSALVLAHECERLEKEVDTLYAKNNGLQDSLFLIRGAADARLKEAKCPS